MARRILSADAALVPHAQEPLNVSVRTESPTSRLTAIQARWIETPAGPGEAGLFDWERRDELMAEIAFVNRAQEFLDEAAVKIAPPPVPVVANVEAKAIATPEEIRAALITQVTGMVRWRESVLWMRDQGVERLVEVGAGKVLSGLARRIDKELDALSLSGPKEIDAFL